MKQIILAFLMMLATQPVLAQIDKDLSQKIALGLAEFRKDILEREQAYLLRMKKLLKGIDQSDLSEEVKASFIQFIRLDFKVGALSNSWEAYQQLPNNSPFKSPYIEEYVLNNSDYAIDVAMRKELQEQGVFGEDKFAIQDYTSFAKELELIDVNEGDRVLHAHAGGGLFDILLGYIYEDLLITVHNKYTDLHYMALDRMDRYPNVNNGNVIEFRNVYEDAIDLENEKWNKIIIRDAVFFSNELYTVLRSVRDNLTSDGHVYVKLKIKSSDKCKEGIKKEKAIKGFSRLDYSIIDSAELGCDMIFKLKSIEFTTK